MRKLYDIAFAEGTHNKATETSMNSLHKDTAHAEYATLIS